jgi:hypothetical protein
VFGRDAAENAIIEQLSGLMGPAVETGANPAIHKFKSGQT